MLAIVSHLLCKINGIYVLFIKQRGTMGCEGGGKCHHCDGYCKEAYYLHIEHHEVSELISVGAKFCDFSKGHKSQNLQSHKLCPLYNIFKYCTLHFQ